MSFDEVSQLGRYLVVANREWISRISASDPNHRSLRERAVGHEKCAVENVFVPSNQGPISKTTTSLVSSRAGLAGFAGHPPPQVSLRLTSPWPEPGP